MTDAVKMAPAGKNSPSRHYFSSTWNYPPLGQCRYQTLKNRILLENYYLPGDLENQIGAFVDHYNNHRYHESLNNVTPADAYFGRNTAIIERRQKIKKLIIQNRRLNHQCQAA